jgi:acyl carrier protein
MATVEQVKQRAREIIAEQLPDAYPDRIDDDTVLADEGNVDSMGFILVLTKLEGEFGATVPDEKWGSLRTLDDVARAIVAHTDGARTDDAR